MNDPIGEQMRAIHAYSQTNITGATDVPSPTELRWSDELTKHLLEIDNRISSYINLFHSAIERFDGPRTTDYRPGVANTEEQPVQATGQQIGRAVDSINERLNEFEWICERINKLI